MYKKFKKSMLSLPLLAALAACSSAADITARNANFVGVRVADGVLSGLYNPTVYNEDIMRTQLSSLCNGRQLGAYEQAPAEQNLVAFKSTCQDGTAFNRAFAEIERLDNGNYSFQVTGS